MPAPLRPRIQTRVRHLKDLIGDMPMRMSLLTVLGTRLGSAALQLVVSASLLVTVGPDGGGLFFANVAAMELAALVSRLGLPTTLARRAGMRRDAGLPSIVMAVVPIAAIAATILAVSFARPILVIAIGAATIAFTQCLGGWIRGSQRPGLAAALYPLPSLTAALVGLIAGFDPTVAYVGGAAIAAVIALTSLIDRPFGIEPSSGRARFGAKLSRTESRSAAVLGVGELANQAVLLVPSLVLVRFASPESALLYGLAVRLIRPLAIARFAINHTFGPRFAGDRHQPMAADQRRLASITSTAMVSAGLIYALVAFPVVAFGGSLMLDQANAQQPQHLTWAWSVMALGSMVNLATGPTGQILAMRDYPWHSTAASLLALALAPLAVATGFPSPVKAALVVALAETVQALTTAVLVRRHLGWASPIMGGAPT